MACTQGRNGVLKADDTAIAQLTSYTLNESVDTIECTNFDSPAYREYSTTFKAFDGSFDVVWDRQDGDVVVGSTYSMDLYPEGEGTGVWKINGDIIVTALEITGATEENVSASVTFQGTGALTRSQTA